MVQINLFKNETEFETFAPDAMIFREGDQGQTMFVVLEGEVSLSIKDKEVERVGPGGVIGEMSLIDPAPRSASARALSACKLVAINENRFNFMVQQTPRFALQIMRVVVDRLRAMNTRL